MITMGDERLPAIQSVLRNPVAKPKLTIVLSHYNRHVPFFDGTVQPEGVDLNVLIVGQSDRQRDGEDRHERMLQKRRVRHGGALAVVRLDGEKPRYAVHGNFHFLNSTFCS